MSEYEVAKMLAECLIRHLPHDVLIKLNNDSVVINRRFLGIEKDGNEYLVGITVEKV